MNTRKLLFSALLISTLTFGASAALAQEDTAPPAETQGRGLGGPRGPMRGEGFRQGPQREMPGRGFGDQLRFRIGDGWLRGLVEEYTGLSFAEVREAHQNGQTFAELVEANGQSVDAFIAAVTETLNTHIDALVENGRITAEQGEELKATAQERITDWVNGEPGPRLQLLEDYTGLTGAELREALQGDATLADLIEANGQSVDAFVATALETMNARIDQAVENGRITAERAEELKALAQERLTARVNGEIPEPLGPMRMMPQGI